MIFVEQQPIQRDFLLSPQVIDDFLGVGLEILKNIFNLGGRAAIGVQLQVFFIGLFCFFVFTQGLKYGS